MVFRDEDMILEKKYIKENMFESLYADRVYTETRNMFREISVSFGIFREISRNFGKISVSFGK